MKYKVGDIVFSTIWNKSVLIKDIRPNRFYLIADLEYLSRTMVTYESNLKSRENDIEKDMEEHQKLCDEIMAIQGIEPIEAEIEEVWHRPEGYQFVDENGNVINAQKIVLEKNENNTKVDMGEVSDGYHTFNELYEYRMLYNAALFNEFAKQGLYDVHKSRKHSDGEYPFGDSNWFIVMAELPTGQISNHYEMKDWDKFQIPEKLLANKWDEHSPRDVADRLISFTTPKKEYPKTYEECLSVLGIYNGLPDVEIYNAKPSECTLFESLIRLKRCRDAYWKIAGEEMGLGKPWEPPYGGEPIDTFCLQVYQNRITKVKDNSANHCVLTFPTEEMRDAFYENFKELINECKELL